MGILHLPFLDENPVIMGIVEMVRLLLSLSLKLNTKITFNHPPTNHPSPNTNFVKGSMPGRMLRFDMQAYLKI